MKLGRYAAWSILDGLSGEEAARFAARVEAWGYSALWIHEAVGREPLVMASHLLSHTSKLIVATGIANIYARDAATTRFGQLTLNELYNGRFLLGLGVSHKPLVEDVRGHAYLPPLAAMRTYLETMDKAEFSAPQPKEPPKRVLAALRPKMLELSRTHADGAHPYLVTPEHTERARAILGPDKLLCVEQKILRVTDPGKARAVARDAVSRYAALPNYRNNLMTLGFGEADFGATVSDRLADALVAWGTDSQIETRLKAHLDAGATQVCIQALREDGAFGTDTEAFAAFAPGK